MENTNFAPGGEPYFDGAKTAMLDESPESHAGRGRVRVEAWNESNSLPENVTPSERKPQELGVPEVRAIRNGKSNRRFFAHHPQTYPKERSLFGAPGAFGAPFTQNDSV
jgi:hypothetical protein